MSLFGCLQQARRQVMPKTAVREVVLSDEQSFDITGEVAASQSLADNEAAFVEAVADQVVADENRVWSIHLYDFESSLTDSEVVFGLAKNRKTQSVACTPDGSFLLFSVQETTA